MASCINIVSDILYERVTIKIHVRATSGKVIDLGVKSNDTVNTVKKIIQKKEGIPIGLQRLSYKESELEDDITLCDYTTEDYNILDLSLNLDGELQVFVWGQHFINKSQAPFLELVRKTQDKLRLYDNRDVFHIVVQQPREERASFDYNIHTESAIHFVFRVQVVDFGRRLQRIKFKDSSLWPSLDNLDACYPSSLKNYIFVKTVTGGTTLLEVDLDETIDTIKHKIEEKEGIPVKIQQLLFRGKELKNEQKLSDHNIRHKATIHILVRPDENFHILVKWSTGNKSNFLVKSNDTIETIKNKIWEKDNIPQDLQEFSFCGRKLEDGKSFADYNIKEGSVLNLILQASPTFNLFVITTFGKQISFEVDRFHTIRDVKSLIQAKETVPRGIQRLVLERVILDDRRTLSYYKIKKDDRIFLQTNVDAEFKILVKRNLEISTTLKIHYNDTVDDIQARVYNETGISPKIQTLYLAVVELKDGLSALNTMVELV